MNKNYVILIIIILSVIIIGLWNGQEQIAVEDRQQDLWHFITQLDHLKDYLSTAAYTLSLYDQNFTEREMLLFRDSVKKDLRSISISRSWFRTIEAANFGSENVYDALADIDKALFDIAVSGNITDRDDIHTLGEMFKEQTNKLSKQFPLKQYLDDERITLEAYKRLAEMFNELNEDILVFLEDKSLNTEN